MTIPRALAIAALVILAALVAVGWLGYRMLEGAETWR